MVDPLDGFSAPARAWFTESFAGPTPAQAQAWQSIRQGDHTLVIAPTGSGKTLAAFMWALDQLMHEPRPTDPMHRCRVVYISPLKALAVDIERNLDRPLAGIRSMAAGQHLELPELQIFTRTGDTPTNDRRSFAKHGADVLITTPESLFLLLTSGARAALAGVRYVIVDEIHALATNKRGAHLALSLERLDELTAHPVQRIGLSATVRPPREVARYLAGQRTDATARRTAIVNPGGAKQTEVLIDVPVTSMRDLTSAPAPTGRAQDNRTGQVSMWPHVEAHLVDLIAAHRATIVFVNSRRVAERLTTHLNEEWATRQGIGREQPFSPPAEYMAQSGSGYGVGTVLAGETDDDGTPVLARAHHGSMSRIQRLQAEQELKAGQLRAVVATSTLELGIDMGSVDLVVQVGAPPAVASGLQRTGRAGHHVGAASKAVFIPLHADELIPMAVIAQRMAAGLVERLAVPDNPLDVLAQQIVAMVAMDPMSVTDLGRIVRRSAPFHKLGERSLRAVLDMLTGKYPSEEMASLRPRLNWNRNTDVLSARPGAGRLAIAAGGTIPDRGLYSVVLAAPGDDARTGRRVGELDEEMVYESRVGDVFALGASSWRIEEITSDRVVVSPAPGQIGRLPFWKGDNVGRSFELSTAIAETTGQLASAIQAAQTASSAGLAGAPSAPEPVDFARPDLPLSEVTWRNLQEYLAEQLAVCGRVSDTTHLVIEYFPDEVGDWRVVVHSPFGGQVNAPWALLIGARWSTQHAVNPQIQHSDGGIMMRLPPGDQPPRLERVDLLWPAKSLNAAVADAVTGSAHFAARFRQAAARALLLPRPLNRRQPLWQQRHRAAQLLAVAADQPDFPIVAEALRECLREDYDVPALGQVMDRLAGGELQVTHAITNSASPFARSMMLGYTAQFMYDNDIPLAERRSAALRLDPQLLQELVGSEDGSQPAQLLSPQVVEEFDRRSAWLEPDRQIADADRLTDYLRWRGPATLDQITAATRPEQMADLADWIAQLQEAGRLAHLPAGPIELWALPEDIPATSDLAQARPDASPDPPCRSLIRRFARSRGPFSLAEFDAQFGRTTSARELLESLVKSGDLVAGWLRPTADMLAGPPPREYCHPEVMRTLRRLTIRELQRQIEPVDQQAFARYQIELQLHTARDLETAVAALAGAAMPASTLETAVLPARLPEYRPQLLDEAISAGDIVWSGQGALGESDGLVRLFVAGSEDLLLAGVEPPPQEPLAQAVLQALAGGAGYFLDSLAAAVHGEEQAHERTMVIDALWQLVWSGWVTNDSWAPMRALLTPRRSVARTAPRARPGRRMLNPRLLPPAARSRGADPRGAGRWSLAGTPAANKVPVEDTLVLTAQARALLARHGLVNRAIAASESSMAALYPVLRAMTEAGSVQRGYFVQDLGGAQFAAAATVDALRHHHRTAAAVFSACDVANPFGSALPWPTAPGDGPRPARRAGAIVVTVDGACIWFCHKGGSLVSFVSDAEVIRQAATELAHVVRAGRLGALTVREINGHPALEMRDGVDGAALVGAGFTPTPRGLRLGPKAPY